MPKRVYNNVEGQRLLDNGIVCEDVTSVTLPTLEHPTTTVSAAGMAADVDMPNTTHLNPMEFSVAHNNGVNCRYLGAPGKHFIELRVVRQRYNVQNAEIEHESFKARVTCVHKSTDKGTVETGNPYGSTEKYSVVRYEEEQDGEIITLVDAASGILRHNGVEHMDVVESMLN